VKRIFSYIIILLTLAACTAIPKPVKPNAVATEMHQAGMPNPASAFCTETGNKLEIRTAIDGSQNGICIFPDGSTCDEWAFFRGECGPAAQKSPLPSMTVATTTEPSGGGPGGNGGIEGNPSTGFKAPGTTEEIADWWGVLKSTEPGAQYDDYFERQDLGQVIYFGIDSKDPAVKSQVEALRDSGKIVHLYGTLLSNVPDFNGSQIQVTRLEVREQTPGSSMSPETTEEIYDWWGVIKSTEPGAQYDDYFERQDLGQIIYFGIDSRDPTVQAQIESLRNSGQIVHLFGTLFSNAPDYNGSQIQVDRIEIE